jgi:CRP-like cAMP-binding protein
MISSLGQILKGIKMFNALDDSQIKYLLENSKLREADKNQVIYNPEEICKNFSVIIKGTVSVIKYSSTGKEQILAYYKAPECFGGVLIFNEEKYPAYFIAQEKSVVLEISKEVIFQLFAHKEFLLFFLKDMSKKIISLSNIIEVLAHTSIKSRVARYIFKEMEKQKCNTIKIEKSKTFIAKELGTVREVVSRVFKSLENQGIIKAEANMKIEILDILALEKEFMK